MRFYKAMIVILLIFTFINCVSSNVLAETQLPKVYFNFTYSLPKNIAQSISEANAGKQNSYQESDEKDADIAVTAFLLSYPDESKMYLAISMTNFKTHEVFKAFKTVPMDTFQNIYQLYIDPTILDFIKQDQRGVSP